MNRVSVWVLSSISTIILVFAIFGVLSPSAAYSMGSSCTSSGDSPCAPQLDVVQFGVGQFFATGMGFLLLGALIGLPAWIASPLPEQRQPTAGRDDFPRRSALRCAATVQWHRRIKVAERGGDRWLTAIRPTSSDCST